MQNVAHVFCKVKFGYLLDLFFARSMLDMVFASLSSTFGERPVNAARDRIVETISMSRSKGNLGVVLGTGAIAAVTSKAAQSAGTRPTPIAPVKRNNFYGGK